MQNTVENLLSSGALRIEPLAQTQLRGDQQLTLLRVEVAPGVQEPTHTHPGIELLYGLAGQGYVELGGERKPLSAGTVVTVERETVKALTSEGDTPMVVLAILVLATGKLPFTPI